MKRHPITTRGVIVVLIMLVGLLGQFGVTPAKADLPSDGRINTIPWVNSWGAVAVYCVDQNGGHSSYTGGSINVTNANGHVLLSASEAQIIQAGVDLHKDMVIASGGVYSLYRQPDGFFRLESKPDNEGKTFIGRWYSCVPSDSAGSARSGSSSAATPPKCTWC